MKPAAPVTAGTHNPSEAQQADTQDAATDRYRAGTGNLRKTATGWSARQTITEKGLRLHSFVSLSGRS